ncbi:MAG: tetratricopeptide repeat protein [Armatimonadota bacterium]|nr:MAG: tetratricopeptide repeat protein [Armatimonadota bacterium]
MLGTRRTPSWLDESAVLHMPPMPAEQMSTLCRKLGLTEAEAGEVCGKLAGLPGAAWVFRGILEQKGAQAARRLVGKKPEKLGRTLFQAAFKAASQSARDVWMVASWFPQPLTRGTAFTICGEDVFKEGVALLERWTVVTEGAERLDLHAWATRTGERALWWQWRKRRLWGARAAAYFALFAIQNSEDRAAVEAELENILAAARLAFRYREWEALWAMGYALDDPLEYAGRWTAREKLLRSCLEGAEKVGNKQQRAVFTNNLGIVLFQRGKVEAAEALYQESLKLRRGLGNRQWEAQTLHQLGTVAQQRGNLEEAEGLYKESLEIEKELGNRVGIAYSLHQLGMVAQARARLEEAEGYYNQSLEIAREVGDRPGIAQSLHQLGMVAQAGRRLPDAKRLYDQSLEIVRDVGDRPREAKTLAVMALLAEELGDLKLAVERTERAWRMFEEMGLPVKERAREQLERLRKRLEEDPTSP